jgi:ribosome-associated translation inhibitor RaiA
LTVKREVQSLRGELDAMRAEKLKSDKVKQELEMRLHRETLRANESSSQSYVELAKVVSSMQMQLRSYRDQLQLGQVTDDRLEASAREVAESSGRVEVRRLQAQRLHEKVQVKVEELKQGEMREQVCARLAATHGLADACSDPLSCAVHCRSSRRRSVTWRLSSRSSH